MKKITILFLSVLTLGLSVASCSSDDDENNASIVGKWEYIQEGTIIDGKEKLEDVENGTCGGDVAEFLADGSFTQEYFYSSDSKCVSETDKGTYTVNDKTLNLKFQGDTNGDSFEILTLNSSTLKVKYTEEDVVYIDVYKRK